MPSEAHAYQIIMLGLLDARTLAFETKLYERASELGLPKSSFRIIEKHAEQMVAAELPAVAIFFGAKSVSEEGRNLEHLIEKSIVIIPIVSAVEQVASEVPELIRNVNA